MRIITRYVSRDFLLTLVMALVVLTFVLSIGVLFKITDLLARGVPLRPILMILGSAVPPALVCTIPISSLVASLLVFSKFSSNSEIMAMKACGLSLPQIMRGPVVIALLLAAACFANHNLFAPRAHYAQRQAMVGLGTRAAMELIDEGRFTQIAPGLTVYVGRKRGDVIENVRIYDGRDPRIKRAIDARSGVLRRRPGGADLEIDLLDVRVDPIAPETPGSASCQRWSLKVENAFAVREYQKKEADFLFGELVDRIRDTARYFPQLSPRDLAIERMTLRVELNSRFSLALSCLTFVLLGVPLGIRSHRKESSVGVAISIGLTFAFYICILLAEEMVKYPAVRPDLIAWLPVAASVALGAWLIHRAN